jgi:CheY-like chemotaxis protein/predicted Ser/Thr protein kinase
MQLLVVHHDAEIGEGLQEMLREYTPHQVDYAASGEAALRWLAETEACDLLVAQIEADGLDGLKLAAAGRAQFPRLQTLFIASYLADEQQLDVAETKVFPEPIDGERLLRAVGRAELAAEDGTDDFHVIDLLQMFCLSRKSGSVQLIAPGDMGSVFLQDGALVDAETAQARGRDALAEMAGWGRLRFEYDAESRSDAATIDLPWNEALIEAVTRRKKHEQATPPNESHLPEVDLSGQTFGAYRVEGKIAESPIDCIYKAEQTSVNRPVALHVLRSEFRRDVEKAAAFLADASANANVQHPAIISVYEAGEVDGTYFYAREFVHGQTLQEMQARRRTMGEPLALRVITAVAEGLSHLNEKGIFHATLTPAEVFLAADGQVRIANLALATAPAQIASEQSEIQTLGRMLIPVVKATPGPGSGKVMGLIHLMQTAGPKAVTTWNELAAEAQKLDLVVGPVPVPPSKAKTGLLARSKLWRP